MKKPLILTLLLVLAAPALLHAHCDRVDGPVAAAAREALTSGDVAKVLIWVGPEQEAELTEAFELAREARGQGESAARLAERFLLETAVRLHREAEGMHFDGLKPADPPLPADLAAAEQALDSGDVDAVVAMLTGELERQVRESFAHVKAAEAQRQAGVEQGRRWVDAYVRYVVYVHGLHETIEAGPAHGVAHRE